MLFLQNEIHAFPAYLKDDLKLTIFEIAVFDSAANFNVGNLATLLLYDSVDIGRGTIPHRVVSVIMSIELKMLNDKALNL